MDQTAIHFRWSLIHVNNQTSEDKFETDMAEVLKMTDKLENPSRRPCFRSTGTSLRH